MEDLQGLQFVQEQSVWIHADTSKLNGQLQSMVEKLRREGTMSLPFDNGTIVEACSMCRITIPSINGWRSMPDWDAKKTMLAIAMACLLLKGGTGQGSKNEETIKAEVQRVLYG